MIYRLAMLAAPLMVLCLPVAAHANRLPTSPEPAKATWLVMNPTTYQAKPEAVLEQFDRVAKSDPRLTDKHRALLAAKLAAEERLVVMVPDGIILGALTGRKNGAPHVYEDMRKQTGREDRAEMFDLGDGVIIYWFTGEKGKSCNNIGVVVNPPQPTDIVFNPPSTTPRKRVERFVSTPSPMLGGNTMFISGAFLPGCIPLVAPGMVIPGSNLLPQQPAYLYIGGEEN